MLSTSVHVITASAGYSNQDVGATGALNGLVSHTNPRSRADNIPINGMPPRIGEEVPGLPPWMQGAPSSPPQNPLTVPYPDVSAPLPPTGPPRDPGMGPDVTMPYIDIPLPDPAAGGPAVVAGGGALLLLILGALAVA